VICWIRWMVLPLPQPAPRWLPVPCRQMEWTG
jgi:hypothetical protein